MPSHHANKKSQFVKNISDDEVWLNIKNNYKNSTYFNIKKSFDEEL